MFRRSRSVWSTSLASALFRGRVAPAEVVPYPRRGLSESEGESLDDIKTSLQQLGNISSSSSSGSPSASPSTSDSAAAASAGSSAAERWKAFVGSGVLGARVPEPFGSALPHTALAHVLESCAHALTPEMIGAIAHHSALALALIEAAGTPEHKRTLVQAMSDGTALVAVAAFEAANGGRDVSMAGGTEVVYDSERDVFTLSGAKDFVPNAARATHFLVFAKMETPRQVDENTTRLVKRLTCFVVPRGAPGVAAPGGGSGGGSGSGEGSVRFDKVELTSANIVGTAGDAYKDLMIAVHTFNYINASAALGIARALPLSLTAAQQSALYAAESALFTLTANIDRPVDDSLVESALVSAGAMAVVESIFADTTQTATGVDGGVASSASAFYRLEKLFTDLKGQHESVGTLKRVAATCGVEEFGLYFAKASTMQTIQLRTLRMMGVRDKLPLPQSTNVTALEGLIVKFSEATEYVFVKYAQNALQQDLLLERLADGAAALYMAICALSRAHAASQAKLPSQESERALAETFAHHAAAELRVLCHDVAHRGMTPDETYGRLAMGLCDRVVLQKMKPIS